MENLEIQIYKRYQQLIAAGGPFGEEVCGSKEGLAGDACVFSKSGARTSAKSGASTSAKSVPTVKLSEIMDRYDAFCFDGYGTLYNRGDFKYPSAMDWYKSLREAGKMLRLVTNAASNTDEVLAAEAAARGFDFTACETISSGSLLLPLMEKVRGRLGEFSEAYYIGRPSGVAVLGRCGVKVSEDPLQPVVAVSSNVATDEMFAKAVEILKRPGGTMLVLNSDAWAPKIDGTREPVSGALSERLRQSAANPATYYLGKPFTEIWNRVRESLPQNSRVLMIGDTLGTDVMGAQLAGFDSALIIGRNQPAAELSADESALGIRPTYYLEP